MTKRWTVALALVVTVVAGLGIRPVTGGAFGRNFGEVVVKNAFFTTTSPKLRYGVATSRLVLGGTFGGWDLLAYPVGVLLAVAVHALLPRSLSRAPRTG